MNKKILLVWILAVFAAAGVFGTEDYRPVQISVSPALDIPLSPDGNLFRLSGGGELGIKHVFPFFHPLSAGIQLGYHLGRMEHADLGDLGALSVLSAEGVVEFRFHVLKIIEPYLSGGAGWFYALRNDSPSNAVSNLVLSGAIGLGIRVSPGMTLGLKTEYRRYNSLYHILDAGITIDLWLGSVVRRGSNS